MDADGNVFHRIGVKAPSDNTLNAAWLPVDNGGTVFTKVVTGNQEWKVCRPINVYRFFLCVNCVLNKYLQNVHNCFYCIIYVEN